jgi:hypothetical protein
LLPITRWRFLDEFSAHHTELGARVGDFRAFSMWMWELPGVHGRAALADGGQGNNLHWL